MEFDSLISRAMEIRQLYAQLEEERYGRAWTTEEIALGLVGDVGDLVKLIMAHDGVRLIEDHNTKLAHELADCLWSLIVLSQRVNINLEEAFLKTMNEVGAHIASFRFDQSPDVTSQYFGAVAGLLTVPPAGAVRDRPELPQVIEMIRQIEYQRNYN